MKQGGTYTLASMKLGERAVIDSFTDNEMSLKLLEMGCTPGETIVVDNIAPMGDPIAIFVSGYLLSLRKKEASTILVKPAMNS
ncbi:MAG: ferrous iron transport protein A [Bacteroidetes bacterium]|nr:ferrous iron transport protein A [Bacteroidota bacterium]